MWYCFFIIRTEKNIEPIEQEFSNLRNWREEIYELCGIFEVANGRAPQVLMLNTATYAIMRQLAAQSQSHEAGMWIPILGDPSEKDVHNILIRPHFRLNLELNDDIPLSSFQVGVKVRVHS